MSSKYAQRFNVLVAWTVVFAFLLSSVAPAAAAGRSDRAWVGPANLADSLALPDVPDGAAMLNGPTPPPLDPLPSPRAFLPVIRTAPGGGLSIAAAEGGSLQAFDGALMLQVPENAVASPTWIGGRNLGAYNAAGFIEAAPVYELTARDAFGREITHFQADLALRLAYQDGPDLPEASLQVYYEKDGQWLAAPSSVDPDANQVTASIDHFTRFTVMAAAQNTWAVGQIVGLCKGTHIRHGPGYSYDYHTIVPENDWAVKVIDGPRVVDGKTWWDTSRREAGDPSGGTGWVEQGEADSCLGGGGGGGGGGITWAVGEIIGLCAGSEIRHGPGLAVHTVVPEDNWSVKIIDGPRSYNGETWWDTSRKEAGDPSGGTGWVSQQQVEAACGGGGGSGYLGPLPLDPALRALLELLGPDAKYIIPFLVNDPIYPPTGNAVFRFTDLSVPGPDGMDLVIERICNSLDSRDGAFGTGCSSLLDMSLRLANDGSVDVRYADGHGGVFMVSGDGYVPAQPGLYDRLIFDGAGFALITPYQTTYLFDKVGYEAFLTAVHDRHGNAIRLERDGEQRVTAVEDAGGRRYSLTYDNSHAVTLADPLGRSRAYTYADGDPATYTDPNGGVYRYQYENRRPVRLTDPENILYLVNIYDDQGRVVEQIDATGGHSYLDYSTAGQTTLTDNLGRKSIYFFDDQQRVTRVQDPLGNSQTYSYDDNHNLVATTDARGAAWGYTYDERGNMLTESGPLGWQMAYVYNGDNDLTQVTDALARVTGFTWTGGSLTKLLYPDGTASFFTYDPRGQALTATDPQPEHHPDGVRFLRQPDRPVVARRPGDALPL